jgi:multidrug resistance efflux pump
MARSGATAAEADLQRAKDELNDATARAERRRANPDFFSKEDLAEAALREKTATSVHEAAGAHLAEARSRVRQLSASQGQTDVRAPFAGQVAERFVGPGSLVNPGTPILRLLASGEPLVRAAVPPEDSPTLKLGQKVGLHLRGTATRLAGSVTRIAPEIDAASQMILIEIALDPKAASAAGLRTGIVVDVEPG